MVPVFQQGFRLPGENEQLAECVRALLQNDGAHLMDLLNIHVDHTIADVAKIVHYEFERRTRGKAAN
jgi:hypothetical protein